MRIWCSVAFHHLYIYMHCIYIHIYIYRCLFDHPHQGQPVCSPYIMLQHGHNTCLGCLNLIHLQLTTQCIIIILYIHTHAQTVQVAQYKEGDGTKLKYIIKLLYTCKQYNAHAEIHANNIMYYTNMKITQVIRKLIAVKLHNALKWHL